MKSLSRVRLCATPWTAAYQAPPSMGFSRQEYWSGLPLPMTFSKLFNLGLAQFSSVQSLSCVRLFVTPWTAAYQTPLSMDFPGKSTGVGCHCLLRCRRAAAAAAKSLQTCLTLCNPRDGSPPGSAVPGILPARILEWVAISFSNA